MVLDVLLHDGELRVPLLVVGLDVHLAHDHVDDVVLFERLHHVRSGVRELLKRRIEDLLFDALVDRDLVHELLEQALALRLVLARLDLLEYVLHQVVIFHQKAQRVHRLRHRLVSP